MGLQDLSKEQADKIRKMGFEARLKNKLPAEDKKTLNKTFRFSPNTWKKFEEVCKINGTKPSKKIDEWVKKFIEEGN